jgi:hypothetical protein
VPRLLAILLGGNGVLLLFRSVWARKAIDATLAWRPVVLVVGSVVGFALTFEVTGLVPAILVSVAIANLAMPENRWWTAVVLSIVLPSSPGRCPSRRCCCRSPSGPSEPANCSSS